MDPLLQDGPVSLHSTSGLQWFHSTMLDSDFVALSNHFQMQQNVAYCGVASGCCVLNALGHPGLESPPHRSFRLFTQDNFFTDEVERDLKQATVRQSGMALAQLAGAIRAHGAVAQFVYAADTDAAGFREHARRCLDASGEFLIVNYDRQRVGQQGGGHISPVGAYCESADAFLVMDTASYRYPFVWVSTDMLHRASGTDLDGTFSRGVCSVASG